jgi:hypothetical protein
MGAFERAWRWLARAWRGEARDEVTWERCVVTVDGVPCDVSDVRVRRAALDARELEATLWPSWSSLDGGETWSVDALEACGWPRPRVVVGGWGYDAGLGVMVSWPGFSRA